MPRSIRTSFAVLAALALAAGTSCAQGPHGHSASLPLPALAFPKGTSVVEMPFVERRNHIVVEAEIEGKGRLPCTLDTGARGTVLFGDSLVRALGLVPAGEARVKGVGAGEATAASLYTGVHVALGGLQLSDLAIVAMPDSSVSIKPMKGSLALGRGLWEQVVAEIDWDTHRVRLHDPAAWHYAGHGAVVPLSFDAGGTPFVVASVTLPGGQPFDVRLVLDTGASHPLQLEPGTDPRIVAPRGERRKIGHGASGQVFGTVGTATFTLGGVTFRDLPVTYPDASLNLPASGRRQGNLGSGLLRRFHVILDYPHQQMILEPGPHVNDPVTLPDYDAD